MRRTFIAIALKTERKKRLAAIHWLIVHARKEAALDNRYIKTTHPGYLHLLIVAQSDCLA